MRLGEGAERSSRWRAWWPFGLLCVLGGSRWILSEALPASSTTLASAALGCGSIAALWLLVFPLRDSRPMRAQQFGRSALGGALVIAGPLIGLLHSEGLSAASLTIAFALTPLVISVAEAAGNGARENLAGRLWPGLAGVAGLLLLLPQPSLRSPGGDLLLLLAPLLTGCGAALFCSAEASAWRMPAALSGATAVLALAAWLSSRNVHVWPEMLGLAAGLGGLQAVLTILVLQRLSAVRWSAQFAVIPLLVLLESLVLMRESVPSRVVGGLLLLAIAGAALLLPPSDDGRLEVIAHREPTRAEP
jgi:drug/metabolite transporter (DMT)-like permease